MIVWWFEEFPSVQMSKLRKRQKKYDIVKKKKTNSDFWSANVGEKSWDHLKESSMMLYIALPAQPKFLQK